MRNVIGIGLLAAGMIAGVACSVENETTGTDDSTSATTGAGGSTTTTAASVTSSTTTTVTTTTTGGGVDEPGAASFQVQFAMDGTDTITGIWSIELLPYDGTTVGEALCVEQFEFTADLDNPAGDPALGCDENGANCTQICPFDDVAEPGTPSGTCIGRFANIVGDTASYQTDCNFANANDWFHPDGGGMAILERFFYSDPVETGVNTGNTMYPTWGDWSQAVIDGVPVAATPFQVGFVNPNSDTDGNFLSWSEAGFLFGLTGSDDWDGTTGIGTHTTFNMFVLVFGG